MRRNEQEVRAELIKRRNSYFAKRQKIKNRIIATVLLLFIIGTTASVALVLPDDGGEEILHGSEIFTPFDSNDDSSVSKPIYSEDCSEENSYENSSYEENSYEDSSYEENSYEDSSYEDSSYEESVSDEPVPPEQYPPEDEVEVDMIYPEMPSNGSSLNLLKTLSATGVNGSPVNYGFASAYGAFSVRLFEGLATGQENALISPLSVMVSLAMTANGAAGDTRTAMENALGGYDIDRLNEYFYDYLQKLPNTKTSSLSLSNALWIKSGAGINRDFLVNCLCYYAAEAYMAPFTEATKNEINGWIEYNTGGAIKNMLDSIPADAMMLLINTLDFDAEWQTKFTDSDVKKDLPFTNADGSTTAVDYMTCSTDSGKYIETSLATGFIKDYDGPFSFVALLPKEEDGLDRLIASLSDEGIISILNGYSTVPLSYAVPKFGFRASASPELIKSTLSDMGMGVAFDSDKADFRRIHDNGAYIYQILQDTSIKVNCRGTKASAATIVVTEPDAAPPSDPSGEAPKEVYLNRPFLYMIVDRTQSMPIFMGTATNMAKSDDSAEIEPVRVDLTSGREYDNPTVNDGVFVKKNPTDSHTKEPYVENVFVIRSMEELNAHCSYWDKPFSDGLYAVREEISEDFFEDNVVILTKVRAPNPQITYELKSVYCHSDTEDSIELVLEYEKTESVSSVNGGSEFVFTLMVENDIYAQTDAVTVRIN